MASQWDPAGEQLAILPNGNSCVFIWSSISKEVQKIDSEFKVRGVAAVCVCGPGRWVDRTAWEEGTRCARAGDSPKQCQRVSKTVWVGMMPLRLRSWGTPWGDTRTP